MTTAQEESSSNEKAQKNDVYAKIDKLIAEISKKGPKTIDFHILKYFQKINYNSERKKDIISIFTKEFTLCEYTPNWIISIKKKNFDT